MLEHKILSIIKRINLIEERIQKIENRFRKKKYVEDVKQKDKKKDIDFSICF